MQVIAKTPEDAAGTARPLQSASWMPGRADHAKISAQVIAKTATQRSRDCRREREGEGEGPTTEDRSTANTGPQRHPPAPQRLQERGGGGGWARPRRIDLLPIQGHCPTHQPQPEERRKRPNPTGAPAIGAEIHRPMGLQEGGRLHPKWAMTCLPACLPACMPTCLSGARICPLTRLGRWHIAEAQGSINAHMFLSGDFHHP